MNTLTESQVWALLGLFLITMAGLGTYYFCKLEDRLRALVVHKDEQVKYFSFIVTQFIGVLPMVLAAACAIMMVYTHHRYISG
ncbi:hypothetical protein [Pseudomonas phage D6]|nr:hypothetical protein [Pseudomonas phage D6]